MTHRSAAVASKIIEFSLRGREFQVSDLERALDEPPSRQTTYRILDQLRADDWLEQRGNGWHPGVKARMLSDVGDSSADQAGEADDVQGDRADQRDRDGPLVDVDDIL